MQLRLLPGVMLALPLAIGFCAMPASMAAPTPPAKAPESSIDKDLSVLENRFFFHHYGHDPVEKRLERIELMTLGASAQGSPAARLDSLKRAIKARDASAARNIQEQAKSPAQYPQVGTLEWKILKKTYPQDSLDARLKRIEEKVFGMPAQAMSYLDRIDRLKKTIGMDVATAPSDSGVAVPGRRNLHRFGPMPRGVMPDLMPDNMPGFMPDAGFGQLPLITEGVDGNGGEYKVFGNGDGKSFGWSYSTRGMPRGLPEGAPRVLPGGAPRGLADVFEDMNRQAAEMMKQFGGSNVEEMPFIINPHALKEKTRSTPRTLQDLLRERARENNSGGNREIPPYSDPDSI